MQEINVWRRTMTELKQYLETMLKASLQKIIISNPFSKSEGYKKIIIENKGKSYQVAKYTDKQVFHENITQEELFERTNDLAKNKYKQINGMSATEEHIILVSKKGNCTYKVKKTATDTVKLAAKQQGHNRQKNYILKEGMNIAPLVDMGVFTKDGKVVNAMYDKYKQINRFIEIIDDEVSNLKVEELNVIDFGCGKSYLTFVVYYYLTEVMNLKVNMIGLDLKEDVIKKCNQAAEKYNYTNLKFEVGDVNGFKAPFDVDMVITLHACDTATDYALMKAIDWKAKVIFTVPCCQHEVNKQIRCEELAPLLKYGLIKERISALLTDAVRANLLEEQGYQVQVMEFIDMEHTPKNILIRAVLDEKERESKIDKVTDYFNVNTTLQKLLSDRGRE